MAIRCLITAPSWFQGDLASASSYENHNGLNVPVVVGGGLNGMLRTGQMISYYDQTSPLIINGQYQQSNGLTYNGIFPGNTVYGGRPYNDLLLTIMKSFGLTSADYGPNGYGVYDCQNTTGLCTASNEGTGTGGGAILCEQVPSRKPEPRCGVAILLPWILGRVLNLAWPHQAHQLKTHVLLKRTALLGGVANSP